MKKSLSLRAARSLFCALALVFILLSAVSFFSSCHLDKSEPLHYVYEFVVYAWDPLFLNSLLLCSLLLVFLFSYPQLLKLRLFPLSACVILAHVLFAVIWVFSTSAEPDTDSLELLLSAQRFAQGDYAFLSSPSAYLRIFPYQLGYTSIIGFAVRLFHEDAIFAMQMLNTLAWGATIAALLSITNRLFRDRETRALCLLLLASCLQPVFLCTFVYGNLLGLCMMLWAIERLTSFLSHSNGMALATCIAFLVVSVLLKYNCLIGVLAVAITLALHALSRRRFPLVVLAAVALVLPLAAQGAVTHAYEKRSGGEWGPGMPQVLWLAMGLHESEDRAAGWYDGYSYETFISCNSDASAASQKALDNIVNSLWRFAQNPARAFAFLGDKLLSQWTEPTFESIWVSEVRAHARPIPPWVRAVYDGTPGRALTAFMNAFQSLIYLFGAVGLWRLRRRGTLLHLPLALTIFGGGLYHMLFEAKSMYILPYYVMLFPYAAYGLAETLLWARKKCARPPA